MTASQVSSVNALLTDKSISKSLLVTIPASLIPSTATGASPLTFSLRLANVYGYFASGSTSVQKSGVALMPIFLSGPAYLSTSRSQPFQIQASTDYSSTATLCSTLISSSSVSFVWSQMSAASLPGLASMAIGGVSMSSETLGSSLSLGDTIQATLSLPAFSMTSGSTYGAWKTENYLNLQRLFVLYIVFTRNLLSSPQCFKFA